MGLRGLKAYQEAQDQGGKFLRLKDGQKVKIRPLQELDESAKNFDPEMGVALFTKEWNHPTDNRRSVVDDSDPKGSVGQELLNKFGWHGDQNGGRGPITENGIDKAGPDTYRPKYFMYLNVLVDDGVKEPYVAVIKGNTNERSVQAPRLIAVHENNGSITDRWFAYSRKGSGLGDTAYQLEPLDKDPKDKFDAKSFKDQLHDLDEASPRVPYERQMSVLRDVDTEPQRELAGAAVGAGTVSTNSDIDW